MALCILFSVFSAYADNDPACITGYGRIIRMTGLHEKPMFMSHSIEYLQPDTPVQILSTETNSSNKWYRVLFRETEGYIDAVYLQEITEGEYRTLLNTFTEQPDSTEEPVPVEDELSEAIGFCRVTRLSGLKASPSLEASTLKLLHEGTQLVIRKTVKNGLFEFYLTRYDGLEGCVLTDNTQEISRDEYLKHKAEEEYNSSEEGIEKAVARIRAIPNAWEGIADNSLDGTGSEYQYSKPKNGRVTLTGIKSGKLDEIHTFIVPKFIDGYIVDSISLDAYQPLSSVHTLIIPEWVTKVSTQPFMRCEIKKLIIDSPDLIKNDTLFTDMYYLEEVAIQRGLPTIRVQDNLVLEGTSVLRALIGNDIKEFVIPEGITHLGDNALEDPNELEKLVLPGTMESLNLDAFAGLLHRITVQLPANCDYLPSKNRTHRESVLRYIDFLVPKGSPAEEQCKKSKLDYAYYRTVKGETVVESTPAPEPIATPVTNPDLFEYLKSHAQNPDDAERCMTDEEKIRYRDNCGEFVGYWIKRNISDSSYTLVRNEEEAKGSAVIKEVERPRSYYIWQYDLKQIKWGFTREQVRSIIGCDPLYTLEANEGDIYRTNLFGYNNTLVRLKYRPNGQLYQIRFVVSKKGESGGSLLESIAYIDVRQKLSEIFNGKVRNSKLPNRIIFKSSSTEACLTHENSIIIDGVNGKQQRFN